MNPTLAESVRGLRLSGARRPEPRSVVVAVKSGSEAISIDPYRGRILKMTRVIDNGHNFVHSCESTIDSSIPSTSSVASYGLWFNVGLNVLHGKPREYVMVTLYIRVKGNDKELSQFIVRQVHQPNTLTFFSTFEVLANMRHYAKYPANNAGTAMQYWRS